MADSEVTKRAVTVYGASSDQIDPCYKEAAYELGRRIAEAGCSLVCGGGKAGLMKAAIDGAVDAGGEAIGVLPHFMVENAWQYQRLTSMIDTPDMHSRKHTMARMSCAAIACPGGCGTFEELMEIITWRQLNLYRGQVVILNTAGYYDPCFSCSRMLWSRASCILTTADSTPWPQRPKRPSAWPSAPSIPPSSLRRSTDPSPADPP